MSKNYIGAKRKRTNTPAAARKRAVEYRHRPYIVKKAAVKAAEEVTELKDLILAEEAEPEIPAPAEEIPEEPAAEKQADTTVPSDSGAAAAAAGAAAAGGFFARAMKSIKGLFSRKEAAKEDTSLVSDVKTWLNSPIDPDAEEEPAETAEAAETGLTEAAEEAEIAVAAGEPEEVSETEEATEETAAAEEVLETAEETAEEEPSESEETPSEEPEENVTEESAEADAEAEEVAAEEATDQEAEEISLAAEEETEESAETSEEETPAEETEEPSEEPASSEAAEEEPAASEAAEEETAEEAAETEVPAEEVTQPEESEDIFAEVPVEAEEPQPEPEPEPKLTRKEKRDLKKAIRKETTIQLLDEKIDSPRAGLFTMLLLPGRAMTRVASVEKTTLSAPSVLILNLIKWAAVGTFFAMFIEKFINIFNFSFIRLNFTGTAGLAFRFGIFGLAAEYLSYIIIGLFCGLIRKKISTLKLMEVESRSALAVALLFTAGCVLVWKDMLAFAVTAAAAGMVIGFITKGYGMDLVLTIGKNTQLVLVLILVVCACLAGFRYFPLTVSGLMDIFKTILHL
jgi:hypothetical protein